MNRVIDSEDADVRELVRSVNLLPVNDRREAIRMLVDIVIDATAASEPLTAAEIAALEEMGERPADSRARVAVHGRHNMAWRRLLHDCVAGRKGMAERLGVDPTRVSQLSKAGRLYSFTADGQVRFPVWQIRDGRERVLPGLDVIIEWLDAAHPLVVHDWMQTPHDHLVAGRDGDIVSPVEWLAGGGSPSELARIIRDDLG